MSMSSLPTIRWGIVATGTISEWFVGDLLLPKWAGQRCNHKVTAIGSSSIEKGKAFVSKHMSAISQENLPTVYGSYASVYDDENVDIVYIGTPHSFHKRNCLDAIAAGKNVLCEKPFTMTAAEAKEVFAAAKEKGVFIMEAVWTRFFPLVRQVQHLLHVEKIIGEVQRTFCDFALGLGNIDDLPASSRYRDPALGAGSLLDLGIYSLTWGLVTLDQGVGETAEEPIVVSAQSLQSGVDTASTFILSYPKTQRQGILSSTTNVEGGSQWARVEGSKGTMYLYGTTPSNPHYFTVTMHDEEGEGKRYDFEKPGRGYFWMADQVAVDVLEGKKEDAIMPWRESIRVMEIMDGIRKRGGARFSVDDW